MNLCSRVIVARGLLCMCFWGRLGSGRLHVRILTGVWLVCSYGCNDHFAPGSLGWCALRNRRCLLSFRCNFMSHLICTVHGNTARLLAAYYNHLEARHQTVHGLDVNDGAAAPWRQALSLSADPLRGFVSSAQSVLCGSLNVTR